MHSTCKSSGKQHTTSVMASVHDPPPAPDIELWLNTPVIYFSLASIQQPPSSVCQRPMRKNLAGPSLHRYGCFSLWAREAPQVSPS
eukprot:6397632-Karenia_brevis.AAC.1